MVTNGYWFQLNNVVTWNGKRFSCLTSTNKCSIKYNILDLNFQISAELIWFFYSWRRRDGEDIDCYSSIQKLIIPVDEIANIPYFFHKCLKDGEQIEAEIKQNNKIKQAMIEQYEEKLGRQIYNANTPEKSRFNIINRYCGITEVLDRIKEDFPGEDFSRIENISNCIVKAY